MSQPLLYSIHDRDAHPQIPVGGWCVDAVLVSDQPPHYGQIRSDINWIVRLNNSWSPGGTIPLRPQYAEFAKRCAMFVESTAGVEWFIVANEPNHLQERPHGVAITPEDYADCFNLCYEAIKYGRREAQVCVAAVAPWDNTSGIDWLQYFYRMVQRIDRCDGFAVHGYTHGADPALIWSGEEVQGWLWHFPVIYQTIEQIPERFRHLPVHVTETDQGDHAWLDTNSGWVQEAYESVNAHNQLSDTQPILSLSLYRWRGDKYELYNKPQVLADFQAAAGKGYASPDVGFHPEPAPPLPPDGGVTPPPSGGEREIDPALIARGVRFEFAEVPAGTGYWRVVMAEWLDEAEADAAGPDHHILGTVVDDGQRVAGVELRVDWPSGHTTIVSKPSSPGVAYNFDFPMSASLNEFSITVDDDNPSDKVLGIGMGAYGNPGIHTSTWIDWQWTLAEQAPAPGHTMYVRVLAGANLRAEPVDGAVLVAVPYRAAVLVYGMQPAADGYEWSQSSYAGYSGWIRSDLLSVIEPPAVIPQPPVGQLKLIWPVSRGRVTQWFGDRSFDYSRWGIDSHDGIDISAPEGTPVLCVGDGEVMAVGNEPDGFGLFVRVWHVQYGFHSLYGHLSLQRVSAGQMVSTGTPLGAVGSTGNSSANHLHLSFRVGSRDDYWRVHTGHKWGASDPMAVYSVVNGSDPNLLI